MDIHSLARLAGASIWVERKLLETASSSLGALGDADTNLTGRWCAIHGDHIRRWGERMPVVPGIDTDSLVRSPGGEVDAAAAVLRSAAPGSAEAAIARTTLLNLLDERYCAARSSVDASVDGPTARLLDVLITETAALLDELGASEFGRS